MGRAAFASLMAGAATGRFISVFEMMFIFSVPLMMRTSPPSFAPEALQRVSAVRRAFSAAAVRAFWRRGSLSSMLKQMWSCGCALQAAKAVITSDTLSISSGNSTLRVWVHIKPANVRT